MVKIAIAGVGSMGKKHLSVYNSKLPNAEVVALFDTREEAMDSKNLDVGGNMRTEAKPLNLSNIRRYTDFDTMLEEGGFDFVDICLPTYLHADTSVRAMESGYHVFCEKPLALTVQEGERIRDAVSKTGRLFSVAHCLRYWPAYINTKKLIDSGKYGKVRYAEFARFSQPPVWTAGGWVMDGSKSGNAALDLHIHDVDFINFMFGKPEGVLSRGVFEKDGSVSHIATSYSYGDKVVQSTGGWICSDSFGFNMRALFILERATIELDFSKSPVVTVYPDGDERYPLQLPEGDGYYYELKSFVDSVEQGKLLNPVTAEDALESLKLCLKEIESAGSGRYISI